MTIDIKLYNKKAEEIMKVCYECGLTASVVYHIVKVAVWADYWKAVEEEKKIP